MKILFVGLRMKWRGLRRDLTNLARGQFYFLSLRVILREWPKQINEQEKRGLFSPCFWQNLLKGMFKLLKCLNIFAVSIWNISHVAKTKRVLGAKRLKAIHVLFRKKENVYWLAIALNKLSANLSWMKNAKVKNYYWQFLTGIMPVLCFYFDRHPAAMVTHETKLVAHISALFFVIKLAASQRSALFNMEENSKLVGSLLRARRNSDSMTCAHWCLSEPLCASFNYQSGQRSLCELNRASGHNLEGLRREPGWLHGVLIARQEEKKPQGEADPNFSTLWDFSLHIFRNMPGPLDNGQRIANWIVEYFSQACVTRVLSVRP